jgi:hypothetical protein
MTARNTMPWWDSRWMVAAAMLIATVPLWFTAIPPLIDLVGHMGRYQVQLHLSESADLQRHWSYHWMLIGNLGADIVMAGLGRIVGVEPASWIIAASLPPLMIWGQVRLARAVHGSVPATVIAAFPFALAYPWQYGLVNFWMGIAVALHAAAWWVSRRRRRIDPLLLASVTILLWTVHIYGWAVFAVLIWSCAIAAEPRRSVGATLRLLPMMAPALLMIALRYGTSGNAAATLGWFAWNHKLSTMIWTLRDQWQVLDIASLILAVCLIYAGLRSRALAVDRGLALAAVLILALIVVLPYQLLGSAFADARLWPVFFIVAIVAIKPAVSASVGRVLGAAAALVFVIRIAVMANGFVDYDRAYASHLRAVTLLPMGAKVAVFVEFPCQVPWRRERIDHFDGMAIVRRNAFTNAQWDVPGAQLLTPLGAVGTAYADPSQLVRTPDCARDLRAQLAVDIGRFPRDRFDYVWAIGFRPETLPRWPGLQPVFADDRTILYRIAR